MNTHNLKPAALCLAVLLAACSSSPTTTTTLENARANYAAAQANPNVARYAPTELAAATDAMSRANNAANNRESMGTIDHLAYIANQRIAGAQELARAKSAEAEMQMAATERDRLRLQARTAEADAARQRAMQAQDQVAMARDQAAAARSAAERAAMAARDQVANADAARMDAQARAAKLEAQLADMQAKQTERGIVLTFGDVLFNVDQAVLSAHGRSTVQRLAEVLRENPERTVLIEGFTDSTGSDAYNLQLSQRRADAVRTALSEMGVDSRRIATRGYGEAYPVAGNDSPGQRQLNRRVEIVLSEAGRPISERH